MVQSRIIKAVFTAAAGIMTLLCLQFGLTPMAFAGADPGLEFYGYGKIVPNPSPAIVDENTHITVTVSNFGDQPATNVQVKLSFNDWGVTFQGWQEIGVVTIPSIPAGDEADAEFDYVFENRAHTCLEALIVSADQNDEENNDRGQINMEVINAGESFEYGVPIVNNGREDLLLQVHGECVHQDPAGGVVAGRCRPVDQLVFVPAGEEVLVPVQVDFFPGTPRGTPLEVNVTAVDFLNPSDVNLKNHVVLQVIYNTPRGIMEDCLAALDALQPAPSSGKGKKSNGLGKKIDEIASHIEKALDADGWVGDSRLEPHPNVVNVVYEQTAVATLQLQQLSESKDLSIETKIVLNRCANDLTDATRILLQTAIRDAGGNEEAEALLEEADALRLKGDGDKTIRRHKTGHVTLLKQ